MFSQPFQLLRINDFYELFVSSVISWEKWMGTTRSYFGLDELKLIKNINDLFLLKLSCLSSNLNFSDSFLNMKQNCIQIIIPLQLQPANINSVNKQRNLFTKKPSKTTHVTNGDLSIMKIDKLF